MRATEMIPAMILSSHTIGLGVIRALGMEGVPIINFYYSKTDMGYVSRYVRERMFVPHPEQDEKHFIETLIGRAQRYGRCVLIPADDPTLTVVSKYKEVLSEYYIVACTGWEITEKFMSKQYTYALAEEAGVAAPRTVLLKSVGDIESSRGKIHYPCIVKPCYSHRYYEKFKIKMIKVEDFDGAVKAFEQAAKAGTDVMLQEYIPGDDTKGVNYNSYFWNGAPFAEFTAEKVRLSPPGFGVPRVVKSKYIPEIIAPGRKILKAMGYYGYSCTEFKLDMRDGIYKLMEVNGRHNRSALLSVRCGINFPWIEYEHLARGKLPTGCDYRNDIYWIDEFRDLAHSLQYLKTERFRLTQYVLPYLKRGIFSVFDARDPLPFLKRCFDLIKMAASGKKLQNGG